MPDPAIVAHASPSARVIGPEDLSEQDLQALVAPDPAEVLFATPDSTHVKLPTGLIQDGHLLVQTAEVRELTGADEELLARESKGKDYYGPAHFLDLILKQAVVSLGDEKPTPETLRRLLLGDRVYLALAIRRLTYGDEFEAEEFVCRLCGKSFGVAIDLRCPGDDIKLKVLNDPRKQFIEVDLKRGTARVRLVNGGDELTALGDGALSVPEQMSIYIRQCTLSVDGQSPPGSFAKTLGLSDRRKIISALGEAAPGPRIGEVSVPCSVCGQSADYALSMADLFLS